MIAILDYDAGNIQSVYSALRHVGGDPAVTSDPGEIERADRLVFPGVGSAAQCMRNILGRGFDRALATARLAGKPVLAVCIGIQMLFDYSEEDGGVKALGLFPGRVRRFVPPPGDPWCKIPHMGWNRTRHVAPHPLLPEGSATGEYYFVHSYYVEPAWDDPLAAHGPAAGDGRKPGVVHGVTEYAGVPFAAMVGAGSFFAMQFHPEKSAEDGLAILERFIRWNGAPC